MSPGRPTTKQDDHQQENIFAQLAGLLQPGPLKRFTHPQLNRVHTYQLVSLERAINWQRAAEIAAGFKYQGQPGHLATITSREESEFVVNTFLRDRPTDRLCVVWIGLSRGCTGNPWQWITDEPF
ncbi:MAG: hypothetical protein RJP95_00425 [Pirellulales bacterium]